VFFVEGEVRPVRSGADEEGAVFGSVCEGCIGMSGAVVMCIGFEVDDFVGRGAPYIWGRVCTAMSMCLSTRMSPWCIACWGGVGVGNG
jgi:hypothetical protein